jgi:adenylate cyclase
MGREIERKFLLEANHWAPEPGSGVRIRQGYLSLDPARIVRVRRAGSVGTITVKGQLSDRERLEFEYPIPAADADALLDRLCRPPLIEKTRYHVPWRGAVWDVDVFGGENAGLAVAEIELESAGAPVDLPPWVGLEVTDDPRYLNASLIQRPFGRWSRDD